MYSKTSLSRILVYLSTRLLTKKPIIIFDGRHTRS